MKYSAETGSLLVQARKTYSQRQIAEWLGVSQRTVRRWEVRESSPPKYVVHSLQQLLFGNYDKNNSPEFTFIDLFAGIGGMRAGFETQGGKCIFTSEWNKDCVLTYQSNFSCDHPVVGDITTINEHDIPEHDVLLAGFPCQPFSIAGVSKKNALGRPHGFACKTQGTLFFDIARIISVHRPQAFLLENVKNLVRHDGGRTYATIKETLELELGYNVETKIIDAKDFVPQHRERAYIVGFKDKTTFSWNDFAVPKPGEEMPWRMKDILHPEDGTEAQEGHYTTGAKAAVNQKYILSDKLWSYLQSYAEKHREKGNGFGYGLVGPQDISRTLSARYYKDGSEILVRRKRNENPRRLTPRECSRLMGFDRDGKKFVIPVSDTQAYRQFGNAVVPPVVAEIARIMKQHIALEMRNEESFTRMYSYG